MPPPLKYKLLTGQRFGQRVVIGRDPAYPTIVRWLCLCDCGDVSSVFSGNLRRGNNHCCVKCRKDKRSAHFNPGSVFDKWTVLDHREKNSEGNFKFLCRCICGAEHLVWGSSLASGRSAGCRKCANASGARKRTSHGLSGAATREGRALYAKFNLYGILPEEYIRILDRQKGLCAICNVSLESVKGGPQVDHCHASGFFRGILCHNCNQGIGHFKDSPDSLRKAAEYLTDVVDVRAGDW